MTEERNVSGRDGYIIASAFGKAAKFLEATDGDSELVDRFKAYDQLFQRAANRAEYGEVYADEVAIALYNAIKYESGLPENQRSWSDMQDMKAILIVRFPSIVAALKMDDEAMGRVPADLIDEKRAEVVPIQ